MIDTLLAYTDWLMQNAADACLRLPADLFTAPTVFQNGRNLGHGNLRDTLLHMAIIEQRWVGVRLLGRAYRPAREEFPPHNYPDVNSVLKVWHIGRALTTQWLTEHTSELDVVREMMGIFGGTTIRCTPRDLLIHALTHTVGHRSDLTSQFSYHGIEPPSVDYIVFVAEKNK